MNLNTASEAGEAGGVAVEFELEAVGAEGLFLAPGYRR